MKNAVVVHNVSKQFRQYHPERPWTLQEALLRGLRRMRPVEQFWALQDVSFEVPAGQMHGVIGSNGSGKSTLLRILGKVMRPDRGRVDVRGRVGALLDLGAGFHHDLTGRENVFVNGVVAGLTRREVAKKLDSIIAFAELEKFIDNPLRTYSTGMQMRLAFAVAVHAEPEILLIDEVLSVGDLGFQRKCLDRVTQFKAQGCAIVLVSHEVSAIAELCDEVIWLRQGQVRARGQAEQVVDEYVTEMKTAAASTSETRRRTPKTPKVGHTSAGNRLVVNENRFGSLELQITDVRLVDGQGAAAGEIQSGSSLRVEIDFCATQPVLAPVFQVHLFRDDGLVCYDLNTAAGGSSLSTVQGCGKVVLTLERVDLASGLYYVDVGAYVQDWSYAYDYHSSVYPLVVLGVGTEAVVNPPHHWEVNTEHAPRIAQRTA